MSGAALEIAKSRASLAASSARRETAEARAVVPTSEAMITHLGLEIIGLWWGQSSHSPECRVRRTASALALGRLRLDATPRPPF